MKRIFLALIVVLTTNVYSQTDTKCQKDFDFVVNYLEKNLPGFSDNVSETNLYEYKTLKSNLGDKIKDISDRNECAKYLVYYIEYFKDNHTLLRVRQRKSIDEKNHEKVKTFISSPVFKSRERFSLKRRHLRTRSLKDVRGIYETADSLYRVAVIPNKTKFRDYIGVIVKSKTKLWKKGQVKFEIKKKKDGLYEGFFYSKSHNIKYETTVPFNNGVLGDGWFKTNRKDKVNHSLNLNRKIEFAVNNNIAYLRIPSFSGQFYKELSAFYKKISPQIAKANYLIVDVRNNGGGNDSNVRPLLKYIYTKPIPYDEVELYATKGILSLYEKDFENIMKDPSKVGSETIAAFREGIKDLKEAKPNSFLPQGDDEKFIKMKIAEYPKKVAILYNRGCASSCETLLFWAKHSDKTILVGENSGGFVGYGNIFTVYTPEYKFGMSVSTTRYKNARKYEVIGIEPDIKLDYTKNWIEQVKNLLLNGK